MFNGNTTVFRAENRRARDMSIVWSSQFKGPFKNYVRSGEGFCCDDHLNNRKTIKILLQRGGEILRYVIFKWALIFRSKMILRLKDCRFNLLIFSCFNVRETIQFFFIVRQKLWKTLTQATSLKVVDMIGILVHTYFVKKLLFKLWGENLGEHT